MAFTCTTLTSANADGYLTQYETFQAQQLITCRVAGGFSVPSVPLVRYYADDPAAEGRIAVAITDEAGVLYAVCLLVRKQPTVVRIEYFAVKDDTTRYAEMGLALARNLRNAGYVWAMGNPNSEFRRRILMIPGVQRREFGETWLDLRTVP